MPKEDFAGLRVLALESRREKEMATLIRNCGGVPTVVPVVRELPLESNAEALAFAEALRDARFDLVVFLTGVGARLLFQAALTRYSAEDFFSALRRTAVAARGPKPAAVLREYGVSATIVSPSPSTWRELLASLDAVYPRGMAGMGVAVQEYGAVNQPLLDGLQQRQARVTEVPVYQWALPEDLGPLRETVRALVRGDFDAILFLSGIQAQNLLRIADQMQLRGALCDSLKRMAVVSIGPSTSEELARHGIVPDLVPSQPKMGILVHEAARGTGAILLAKRGAPRANDGGAS